jgi:NAD(P)H dehydrogenase (quinone)
VSNYVSNILLVLASPFDENDKRLNEIGNLCHFFGEQVVSRGVSIDTLDLYKEKEFLSGEYLDSNASKVLEYQIRINKADMIVIFHPVWFDSVPAVLKGWLENVMTNNFAYRTESRLPIPLLTQKNCLVVAFDERQKFQSQVLFGNQLDNFWNKTIFNLTGLSGKLHTFYTFRSATEKDLDSWRQKISQLAERIRIKPSVLDL